MFDYSDLFGLMKKRKVKQYELATKIGINPATLSIKISGDGEFKQGEILKVCRELEIPEAEIGKYFFAEIV